MKKIIFILLLSLPFFAFAQSSSYTYHKVLKGQTLYGIAKLYGKSIDEIKKVNPSIDFDHLKLGETVKIPAKKIIPSATNEATKETTSTSSNGKTPLNNITHIVKSGETVYSIAKIYAISTDLLLKTNNLNSGNIQIGQALIIPGSNGTTTIIKASDAGTSASNTHNTQANTTKKEDTDIDMTDPTVNNLPKQSSTNVNHTTELENNKTKVNETTSTQEIKSYNEVKTESEAYNFSMISNKSLSDQFSTYASNPALSKQTSKGVASYMQDASATPNFIAMYNGSPIGSVVRVKNLMNGRVIYVKVVGKLPDLDKNKDLNIKISEAAAKVLGVVDEKFLNEIEFYISK